jgi:hypothetical protein
MLIFKYNYSKIQFYGVKVALRTLNPAIRVRISVELVFKQCLPFHVRNLFFFKKV